MKKTFQEVRRVLKRPGKCILIETLGTMTDEVNPPGILLDLYEYYEAVEGYTRNTIRTDYKFKSVREAVRLCTFFFGDEVGKIIQERGTAIVPEYTGVWINDYSQEF